MLLEDLSQYRVILASQSPRRQYLLKELGIPFEIKVIDMIDESYPLSLQREQIPAYLAEKKASHYKADLDSETIVITADTIVWLNNGILQKPTSRDNAIEILSQLSGKTHQVYTGVCLSTEGHQSVFSSCTDVQFKPLTMDEIIYYIDHHKPYDKAGAYGIQEWIGYIGVESINGSFFNVMGLPIQKLYIELQNFINRK